MFGIWMPSTRTVPTCASSPDSRYCEYLEHQGNRATSIATTMFRLRSFFGDELWRPLRRLDSETCQRLYDNQVTSSAIDTHRNALSEAKTFLAWCVRHRHIAVNPVERIRPLEKRRHGKPQLRIDEARAWTRAAADLADAGKPGAVAAMMALLMAMRCTVPVVCAHAMRGLHSRPAIDAGVTPQVVAFALGHPLSGNQRDGSEISCFQWS